MSVYSKQWDDKGLHRIGEYDGDWWVFFAIINKIEYQYIGPYDSEDQARRFLYEFVDNDEYGIHNESLNWRIYDVEQVKRSIGNV